MNRFPASWIAGPGCFDSLGKERSIELAKSLIMLVRVLGLLAIILGSLSWVTGQRHYLAPHIGIGFCVAVAVVVMSVIAIFHSMGAVQGIHIALAFTAIGVAERLYSTIRRA